MAKQLRLAAAFVSLLAVAAPSGAENATELTPPFFEHEMVEFCSAYNVLDACDTVATARKSDGTLEGTVRLVSPEDGALPGRGMGWTEATVEAAFRATEAMTGTTFVVHVQVDEAVLGRTGVMTNFPWLFLRDGRARLDVQARPHACPQCNGFSSAPLLDEASGLTEVRNVRLAIPVTLRDCWHPDMATPPGLVWVRVKLIVNQSLGADAGLVGLGFGPSFGDGPTARAPDTGISTATVRARVERIEVQETETNPC